MPKIGTGSTRSSLRAGPSVPTRRGLRPFPSKRSKAEEESSAWYQASLGALGALRGWASSGGLGALGSSG